MIHSENADRLALLRSWGKGSVETGEVLDGETAIIRTPQGVYLYDTARDWRQIAFLSDVVGMALDPDETTLATWYENGTVRLWEVASGTRVRSLERTLGRPRVPGEIPPEFIDEFLRHTPTVGATAFSADGKMLAVGYVDGVVAVWRTEDGAMLHALEHIMVPATDVLAFSADGHSLAASGGWGSTLSMWRLTDERLLWRIPNAGRLPSTHPYGLSPISTDGARLISVSGGGRVLLRKSSDGSLIRTIATGLEFIDQAGFTPDGQTLVILGVVVIGDEWQIIPQYRRVPEGTLLRENEVPQDQLRLAGLDFADPVSTEGPQAQAPLPETASSCGLPAVEHYCGIEGVQFTADRDVLAWGSNFMGAYLWRIVEASAAEIYLPTEEWSRIGVSADGKLALACSQSTLEIFDLEDGSRSVVPARCQGASVLPDGKRIVIWSATRVQEVSIPEGQVLGSFLGYRHPVSRMAFSDDGGIMASGSEDTSSGGYRGPSEILVWDPGSRSRLRTFNWWGTIDSRAFSPDSTLLGAGSASGAVRIWRLADGWLLNTLQTGARALAFSHDSTLLATGGWGGTIQLWQVSGGMEVAQWMAHTGNIVGLAFSPDGTSLISASDDGTLKLWGVK